jgi:hypothetical protein
MRKVPDNEVKPGMIVELKDEPGKKYEVLSANGAEKQLIRRDDLDTKPDTFRRSGGYDHQYEPGAYKVCRRCGGNPH